MLVFTNLRLLLYMVLKLSIIIAAKEPLEYCLLDLLVVLLFEEVIVEKLNGAKHKELTTAGTDVESANWTICGETDGTTRDDGYSGAVDIERSAVRIDEL